MAETELPTLTADQVATRLGIKLETLYAYVARGRLSRTKGPEGSAFDPLEVERFAATRRGRTARDAGTVAHGHSDGSPLMVIDTDLTLIEDGELFYRGRPAVALALSETFEQVAHWVLTGRDEAGARLTAQADSVTVARRVTDALPASATLRDRQQVAVTTLAALDPLRHSLDPETVVQAGESLVAGMVAVLPDAARFDPAAGLAARLWSKLTDRIPDEAGIATLNATLILLLDHDVSVSTLAARAAASARANVYAVVTAGLGALDSPLHGNASRQASRMLARIVAGESPERVIADTVVAGGGAVPGFGQPLYPGIDPRARTILELLDRNPGARPVTDAVARTAQVIASRTGAHPNVDLGLAALTLSSGMSDDAGEAIFATARSIGWIAHALAEYRERPLRLRPVGRYRPTE